MSSYSFYILGLFCLVAVAAHGSHSSEDSRDDDHKDCGGCEEIKRGCRDYYGTRNCFRPKITEIKDKHGCKAAIVRCRSDHKSKTLMTSRDDVLFNGEGSEKLVTCRKNKWHSETVDGDRVRFSTVYCLDDTVYPQGNYPPPQYPSGPVPAPNYPSAPAPGPYQ